jgi:hypothetical protein
MGEISMPPVEAPVKVGAKRREEKVTMETATPEAVAEPILADAVKLTFHLERQEAGCYLAWCDELDQLLVEGETAEETVEQLLTGLKLIDRYRQNEDEIRRRLEASPPTRKKLHRSS